MSVIEKAAGHFRSVISILVLILLAGGISRNHLTLEHLPDVAAPFLVVSVVLDGVSPQDGDRLLARPLENELRTLDGIKEISSTSRESYVVSVIEFETDIDIHRALQDTREAVNRAKAEFPIEAEEPLVEEISANEFPAIVVALTGDKASERELFNAAQKLKLAIEGIPGVLEANLVGEREEVAEAIVDPTKLQYYNLSSAELINAVVNNNLLVPAGELDQNGGRFSVKVPGIIETAQDIYNLPLRSTSDGAVTLRDVAQVRRSFKDPKRYTYINGKPGITIDVEKRRKANDIDVSTAVRATVASMADQLPSGVEISFLLDQSNFVKDMVSEMEGNILTAMALVMIIVVAALGVRSGILVGFGIPFSLLFALIVLNYIGYSFNMMVMFGMLLALGMLIDGAIVIVEFADRKMAEGLGKRAAYQIAVKRMFWPVTASTATTLAVFLPIMLWPGMVGQFMRFLPVTVFTVLVGSLLYALFFAPVLGAVLGGSSMTKSTRDYLAKLEGPEPERLPGITGLYGRMLDYLVGRPIRVFLASIVLLAGIFVLYGQANSGLLFFADTEEVYGTVTVRAQGNLSVEDMRRTVAEVERRVLSVSGVKVTYSASGSGSNMAGSRSPKKDQIGSIFVELNSIQTLPKSSRLIFEDIRHAVAGMPGIIVDASLLEGGPDVGDPIQIQLQSADPSLVLTEAHYLASQLGQFEGLRNIADSTPEPGVEWALEVDRSLAAQLNANLVEVGRAVQLLTTGVWLGEYRPDDAEEEVEIRLRYPQQDRSLAGFDSLWVNTSAGPVPISSFVERKAKPKVDNVRRINGLFVATVTAGVEEGVLADDKVKEISQWLENNPLNPGVDVVFRGANEEQAKSAAFLSVAFSLALFLMFILLVTQFNSFYQSALILSAVIMSTAGVLLGLLITQQPFSVILTGTGIVALAGIVVNNNIVLIDTFNHIRTTQHNVSTAKAAVMASVQRLRPVFLTTITTILGLLPIGMGFSIDLIGRQVTSGGIIASQFTAMASAIVSGLAFSTVLTLLVTPVMLVLPSGLKEQWRVRMSLSPLAKLGKSV